MVNRGKCIGVCVCLSAMNTLLQCRKQVTLQCDVDNRMHETVITFVNVDATTVENRLTIQPLALRTAVRTLAHQVFFLQLLGFTDVVQQPGEGEDENTTGYYRAHTIESIVFNFVDGDTIAIETPVEATVGVHVHNDYISLEQRVGMEVGQAFDVSFLTSRGALHELSERLVFLLPADERNHERREMLSDIVSSAAFLYFMTLRLPALSFDVDRTQLMLVEALGSALIIGEEASSRTVLRV
jgi:hypothetical protein